MCLEARKLSVPGGRVTMGKEDGIWWKFKVDKRKGELDV
jgi:hypothetical protein